MLAASAGIANAHPFCWQGGSVIPGFCLKSTVLPLRKFVHLAHGIRIWLASLTESHHESLQYLHQAVASVELRVAAGTRAKDPAYTMW
jgi:hypothetical protein